MKDPLLSQLKQLKQISPRKEFSEMSLRLILASQKQTSIPSFTLPLFRIGALVGILGFVALIAIQNNEMPLKIAGLDESGLEAEARELELTLKLAEVTYNPSNNETTKNALEEVAQNDSGHLNTSVINKEAEGLNPKEYINEDINDALREASE